MAALTHVGNKLLIIRGKWRGWIGEIKEIKHLPCGLIDYVMEIDDSDEDTVNKLQITVQAEDCREYNPGSINLESPFDITNYLSVNQMRDIAKDIYTSKVNSFLDEVFKGRCELCGSIPVQVLDEIVKHYAATMFDKYKDELLDVFKRVIESDTPASGDDDEKCFGRAIQWALERVAQTYIDNHPSEITDIMKDEIHKNAERMIMEKWSWSLSHKLEETAKKVIDQGFNITNEKQ